MKKGVLFINLGTTAAPEPGPTGTYLREFLNDPYVIDIPNPMRWILVNWIIVPRRKAKSAAAYRAIWSKEGSPLLVHSRQFVEGMKRLVSDQWKMELGMRYGSPSIRQGLESLRDKGVEELYLLPLYPQFADSSTTTALVKAVDELKRIGWNPARTQYLGHFFWHPAFIRSLAQRVRASMNLFSTDHLLLSYHGLPERHLEKRSDLSCGFDSQCCAAWSPRNRLCYRAQCFATSRALLEELNWPAKQASTVFQSRLGKAKWIGPDLESELARLVEQGVKRVLVACPSFVTDCLETLEEIGIRARATFRQMGGEDLHLVDGLNSQPYWIGAAATLLESDQWRPVNLMAGQKSQERLQLKGAPV